MKDDRLSADGLVGYPPPVSVVDADGPDTATWADAAVTADLSLDPYDATGVGDVLDGDSAETGEQLPEYLETQHTGQRSTWLPVTPVRRFMKDRTPSCLVVGNVSGGCDPGDVIPWNLLDLDKALRTSWAADTCSPDNQADWQPDNPAWGHCDITSLIVNDVFGGDLMVGEVHLDGVQHGFHWWNRLPSGAELDLTREQFQHGQTVTAARVVKRPRGPLPRRWEEYLLLRERVTKLLGSIPEPA